MFTDLTEAQIGQIIVAATSIATLLVSCGFGLCLSLVERKNKTKEFYRDRKITIIDERVGQNISSLLVLKNAIYKINGLLFKDLPEDLMREKIEETTKPLRDSFLIPIGEAGVEEIEGKLSSSLKVLYKNLRFQNTTIPLENRKKVFEVCEILDKQIIELIIAHNKYNENLRV